MHTGTALTRLGNHVEVPHTTFNNHTQHIIYQRFTLLGSVEMADLVLKGSNIKSCPNCCDFFSFSRAAASPPRPPLWKTCKTWSKQLNFFLFFGCIIGVFLLLDCNFERNSGLYLAWILKAEKREVQNNSDQELLWRNKTVKIRSACAEYHILCEHTASVGQT